MTDIRISESFVFAITTATAESVEISALYNMGVVNFPSASIEVSSARVDGVIYSSVPEQISQLFVMAVVKGRIDDWELRAWTFSLDGHNFYVLKIGMSGTLVYDTETKQWSDWRTFGLQWWRLFTGMNWLGMSRTTFGSADYSTNIVAGDDATGRLYILDPTRGYDESPLAHRDDVLMQRVVTGIIPMRGREVSECYGVYVTGSLAEPAVSGAQMLLRTSDDDGETWAEHGYLTVDPTNFEQEFSWRSLGRICAPGRLFEVSDDGAMQRIDGADMSDRR